MNYLLASGFAYTVLPTIDSANEHDNEKREILSVALEVIPLEISSRLSCKSPLISGEVERIGIS